MKILFLLSSIDLFLYDVIIEFNDIWMYEIAPYLNLLKKCNFSDMCKLGFIDLLYFENILLNIIYCIIDEVLILLQQFDGEISAPKLVIVCNIFRFHI